MLSVLQSTAMSEALARIGHYRDGALKILAGPVAPRQYRALFNAVQPGTARVVERRRLTDRASALLIQTHSSWPRPQPGQHLGVGVDVAGTRRWRTYSITAMAGQRLSGELSGSATGKRVPAHHIEIAVQAIPGGRVSPHLAHTIEPGEILQVRPAEGEFVLPARVPKRVLFLTAGSGITPIMGILRHHLSDLDQATLVHAAPTAADVLFDHELTAFVESGRIRVMRHFTTEQGRLDPKSVAQLVPEYDTCETWACGPPEFLDHLAAFWQSQGLEHKLHVERFQPRLRHSGSGGVVRFSETGAPVASDGSGPLLAVGEAHGIAMPSGCRMGICYRCAVPLVSGSVRDLRTGEVTSAEPGEHVTVQTCISGNAGDCVLSVPPTLAASVSQSGVGLMERGAG